MTRVKFKFTDEQAEEIRRRVAAGESQASLCRELGASASSVSKVVLGHTYTGHRQPGGLRPRPVDPKGRVCNGCGEFKSWDNYSPSVRGPNGRLSQCKPCRAGHNDNPEARRREADRRLRRQHGITLEQYEELLAKQGGRCALCRRPERATRNGAIPRLHVDHDHRCCSGVKSCVRCIRGLLCNHCNRVVGHIEKIPGFEENFPGYVRLRPLAA